MFFQRVSSGGSRCRAVPDFAALSAAERLVGVESQRAGTEFWNGRLAVGSFQQLGLDPKESVIAWCFKGKPTES